jgi:hypothetical protein
MPRLQTKFTTLAPCSRSDHPVSMAKAALTLKPVIRVDALKETIVF